MGTAGAASVVRKVAAGPRRRASGTGLSLPIHVLVAMAPFLAFSAVAFPRDYIMAPAPLPYDEAEAWCRQHHGPTAMLAGYTGYPPEELALMRLCPSDQAGQDSSCWVLSPFRKDGLCHVQTPAPFDPKVLIGDMGRLSATDCDSAHRFMCAVGTAESISNSELDKCRKAPPITAHNGEPSPEALAVDTRNAPLVLVAEATPIHKKQLARRTSLTLSWFIAATNDEYGGYRAALRSSAALAAVVHGSHTHGLYHDSEVIVVDWGSDELEPLRCTPEFKRVLATVPYVCEGHRDDRVCTSDFVRMIQVPRLIAQGYAPGSPCSEVHTINIAARKARGKMLLRIDQDTLTQAPFFGWLAWQKQSGWPDIAIVWWYGRDSGIARDVVPSIPGDIHHYVTQRGRCNLHEGRPPVRPPYDNDSPLASGAGGSWAGCHNAAVGVYGYPVEMMIDVRGFNEGFIYWGGMEAEFCTRAKNSSKFVNWADLRNEVCPDWGTFTHMQHEYGERRHQGMATLPTTKFVNDESWGLVKETLGEWLW